MTRRVHGAWSEFSYFFLQETAWLCKICAESRELWKKSGAWFFKGMPKAQEIEAAMQPTKPGAGHKKERRFTVYKPTRVEREEEEQAEAEVGINIPTFLAS